jgi:hypothetical protein
MRLERKVGNLCVLSPKSKAFCQDLHSNRVQFIRLPLRETCTPLKQIERNYLGESVWASNITMGIETVALLLLFLLTRNEATARRKTVIGQKAVNLLPGMTLIVEDSLDFYKMTVTSNFQTWVALGLSQGNVVSMNGGGKGSDVYVCSSGKTERYWITQFYLPAGIEVPGSTCVQESGKTVMVFDLPKERVGYDNQILPKPGSNQMIIFARGSANQLAVAQHTKENRNGLEFDFAVPGSSTKPTRKIEAVLLLHSGFMIIAWGFLLPFGVSVANRGRWVEFAPAGSWFKVHKTVQYSGWLLQLIGAACAICYCQKYSSHFATKHAWIGSFVVMVGTLQPLNAFFRPHPPFGGWPRNEKPTKRVLFEIFHKAGGWIAVIVGMVNVYLGIVLADEKQYEHSFLAFVTIFSVLSSIIVLLFFFFGLANPNNPTSQFVVGAKQKIRDSPRAPLMS